MKKTRALQRWHDLEPDQDILPFFTPLSADAHGSTFGACGIRISGNPQFIDAVLSRLKDLLKAESATTRLTLARSKVKAVFDKKWQNADADAETCYIQIRERTAITRQKCFQKGNAELPTMESPAEEPRDGLASVKGQYLLPDFPWGESSADGG